MRDNYILHHKNGAEVITAEEIIFNAMEQENSGIEPHYAFVDYKTKEPLTPPGWLVWSTWEDGAGVCYRHPETGRWGIVTGWQADFCYA